MSERWKKVDTATDRGATLYADFLHGDVSALEQLVRLHGDALTRFAYCIVKDADAAEDVTADTFAALIVKRKKFRNEATFKTYLYTIARNKAIDHVRRIGKNRPLTGLENVLQSADDGAGPEVRERNERLYAGMQKLPAPYKEVLYLNYFDGFSVEEMCRILKKNRKQIYNLLARARSTLKLHLVKEGFSHEDI